MKQQNKIEWQEVELKNLGLLIMGQSPKGNSYNDQKKGVALLNGAADFKNNKIVPKQFTTKPTKLAKEGDLLFCIRATIGKSIISDGEYCLGRGVAGFRAKKESLNSKFLLKILDKKLNELVLQGSTIRGVRGKDIESIKISLPFKNDIPDLKEQERIVSILEKAETLKQKGKKTEDLLDEYLKSIFYEMFYNKGFESKPIKELCEVISGSTPSTSKEEYWNGNIDWITPAELKDGDNYYYSNSERKITKKGLQAISGRLFPRETVMLTTRAPIGKVAIAGKQLCTNQGFKNMICKKELNPVYLYFWFLLNKEYLNSLGVGATFKEISKKIVEAIKIPFPPLPLQQKFAKIVEHVERLKENIKKPKQNSEKLFNSLMSKAFRGELVK